MKGKAPRTMPKIAGSQVYGKGDLAASPGNSVYKHRGEYHVYMGLNKVLVTRDLNTAFTEAARKATNPEAI